MNHQKPKESTDSFYLFDDDNSDFKYFDDIFSDDPIYSNLCTSKLKYMKEELDEETLRMLADF